MSFVFNPPERPSVALAGESNRFPVRRIFCVGRNYAAHAREMGGDPDREPPFFFTKPADAVVDAAPELDCQLPYPLDTKELHHEIELALAVDQGGTNLTPEDAQDCIFGYAVALDLTRRDLQRVAKERRRPWDWGKAFDRSAPLGPLHRATTTGPLREGRIWVDVDGQRRQDADLAELIWPPANILAFISRSVALKPGDLVLTGTPAGVGPLEVGQRVRGGIDGLGELALTITDAAP